MIIGLFSNSTCVSSRVPKFDFFLEFTKDLYVIIMSRTRFRVNLHPIVA